MKRGKHHHPVPRTQAERHGARQPGSGSRLIHFKPGLDGTAASRIVWPPLTGALPISIGGSSHPMTTPLLVAYPASRTHLVAATAATVKKRAEIDIIADHQTIKWQRIYRHSRTPCQLECHSANVGLARRSPPSRSLTASRTHLPQSLSHHKSHHIEGVSAMYPTA